MFRDLSDRSGHDWTNVLEVCWQQTIKPTLKKYHDVGSQYPCGFLRSDQLVSVYGYGSKLYVHHMAAAMKFCPLQPCSVDIS